MKEGTVALLIIAGVFVVGLLLWYSESKASLASKNNAAALQAMAIAQANAAKYGAAVKINGQDTSIGGIVNTLADSGTLSDIADVLGNILG